MAGGRQLSRRAHVTAARTRTDVMWSVGTSGSGAGQFAAEWPAAESGTVLFRPGFDDPRLGWPAFHPGPLDVATGSREHRCEIAFHLASPPVHGAVLTLRFSASHGPCPEIEVELDNRRGRYTPVVDRTDRSEVERQSPIAGPATLEIGFPAAWLGPGGHRLALTTVLDPGDDLDAGTNPDIDGPAGSFHRAYGSWFGSGISWDCVTFVDGDPALGHGLPGLAIRALPLVRRHAGGPEQLVEVLVDRRPGEPDPGSAFLTVGRGPGRTLDRSRPALDFGQRRSVVGIEPLTGSRPATVSVAGRTWTTMLVPGRRWTLHLVPHVHLDVGFTDHQAKVLELHSRNLDRVVAAVDAGRDVAYSVDGAVVVREYLATRPAATAARVVGAIRDGRIAVNAFHSVFLTGLASLEECWRAARLAGDLRTEYGIPVTYANLTDVPSYSGSIPAIVRGLGLDAFVGIENHGRAATADSDLAHLLSPVQWEGLDGSRVLAWFTDSYSQLRFMAGDPQTLAGAAQALTRFVDRYERPDYLPADLPIIGTHADNEDFGDGDVAFVDRWNEVYLSPRLVVSTIEQFLETVRPLSDRLPVWRGDGGSFWEDGAGSAASVVAVHRAAQQLLPAAEAFAALLAIHPGTPGLRPDREELDRGWDALLSGSEHTWTWSHAMAHPQGEMGLDQAHWKGSRVQEARRVGSDQLRRSLSQLGESVTTDGPTVVVANPLSWSRDVDAEVEVPSGAVLRAVGPDGVADIPAPFELMGSANGLDRRRYPVADVPAFGYRTLRQREGGVGASRSAVDSTTGHEVVTGRWRALTDPTTGAVTSLRHLPTGRELLDPSSPWSLGTVVYAGGPGDASNRGTGPGASTLTDRRPLFPPPRIDLTVVTTRPAGVRRTPDGVRLAVIGSGPSLPEVRVEVLLRDASDRVDVVVELTKEHVQKKESLYVVFPFETGAGSGGRQDGAAGPRLHYDRQLGWVDPSVDHSPGACNEWFTTQDCVVVQGPAGAVAWSSADAPLFCVDDVVRGRWPEKFAMGTSTLLSWVMNNYWPTNAPPSQGGRLRLRYAFAPADGFEPAAATRLGRELRAAPAVSTVTWLDKADSAPRPLPAGSGRLVDFDAPGDVAVTVAGGRSDGLVLVRVQEIAGRARAVGLRVPAGVDRIRSCLADERPTGEVQVVDGRWHVDLPAWGIRSFLLEQHCAPEAL